MYNLTIAESYLHFSNFGLHDTMHRLSKISSKICFTCQKGLGRWYIQSIAGGLRMLLSKNSDNMDIEVTYLLLILDKQKC